MNSLTIVLLIIVVLIIFILIRASMLENEYTIEEEIIIDKPKQEVFEYIKFLKNHGNFNKWVMMDPNMKKEYKGTDGTVGFVYAWDSDNKQVGKGEQQIKKMIDGESIDYEIRFIKPFQGTSFARLATTMVSANQTKVKWSFFGMRTFGMKLMHMLLNLKKMLAKDLATSLRNLKAVLEKK